MNQSNREYFEEIYRKYNRFELIDPDPLQFLHDYENLYDREIVGLIASSLAYGRVAQILKSVEKVLTRIGSPREYIETADLEKMRRDLRGFKHRFTTSKEMAALLYSIKGVIYRFGSLYSCMKEKIDNGDENILKALGLFVDELRQESPYKIKSLLPHPKDGSACKRLCLFLRWMVRCDEVDPGGWAEIPASKLIVPLDTHMYKIGRILGLTSRKQADIKTAIEITNSFKRLSPNDPVRYDFAFTRFGIRKDMEYPIRLSA